MLALMASLSRLYSDREIPYLYYRVTENLFCKYCNAKNISRDDTAYDAKIGDLGIGIKTFQIANGQSSTEKVAEFDKLSPQLRRLKGEELALKLADFRNERMESANILYGVKQSEYHIIGRTKGHLVIFDTPYDFIDKDSINVTKDDGVSISFTDKKHSYTYSHNKSTLKMQFVASENRVILPVSIIEDPFTLLQNLITKAGMMPFGQKKEAEFVILPLFAVRGKKDDHEKYVPECSGLNQWNAGGRARDFDEVYVPIPRKVHKEHPDFFPGRDTSFWLHLPNEKDVLSAKVCQQGDKALMTNPNKALGEWLLRKVLRLKQGELLTYDRLLMAGFDSLRITKLDSENYQVDVATESYSPDSDEYNLIKL